MNSSQPRFGQFKPEDDDLPTCVYHPGEAASRTCQRCNQPICIKCAISAPVGVQCRACVQQAQRRSRRAFSLGRPGKEGGLLSATYVLIGLCLAVFLAQMVIPKLTVDFGFIPAFSLSQPWRFVTTAFLHAGVVHLLLNMFALWQVGPAVEQALGRWRFLGIYLVSALGGSVAVLLYSLFVDPHQLTTNTVGASGAVFGLFAAVFMIQRHVGANTIPIVVLLVINMIWSFTAPGVSWQGHLGGMLSGAAITGAYLLVIKNLRVRREKAFRVGGTQAAQKLGTGAVRTGLVTALFIAIQIAAVALAIAHLLRAL